MYMDIVLDVDIKIQLNKINAKKIVNVILVRTLRKAIKCRRFKQIPKLK